MPRLSANPRVHTAGRVTAPYLPGGTARRYAIWEMQVARGQEPCFRTPVRFECETMDCPWREECLDLRAIWRQ